MVADVLLATLDEATAALDTAREEWSRTYEYSAERNDLHNVPDGAVFWPWLKAAVIARARASFHDRFGGVQTNRGFPVTLSRAVARLERDGLIAVSVREDAAGRTIRIIALRRVLP